MTRETGAYVRTTVAGEEVRAFVPEPLPPALEGPAPERLGAAQQALVRLDLAGGMVPSLDWFIDAFVRKEAVVSSQIEGTQATLVDLLTFEAEGRGLPDVDVEEIGNYLDALEYARGQLGAPGGLPLSMRLANETHRRLMRGVRGHDKQPGEIRRSQNWIGGSRPGNAAYVPAPPHLLRDLLSDFERYIHAQDDTAPLVRVALVHAQFETIHPYLDGNGRIGRLLVTLLLEQWNLLTEPLLYLSLFFKRNRDEYYRRLNAIRTDGDWEAWIDFFLDGVAIIADEAVVSARTLFELVSHDRTRVLKHAGTSVAAARLFELLPRHPIVSVSWAIHHLGVSKPTAGRSVGALENAGVLVEITGKKRDRLWAYQRYLELLQPGTELETGRR